MGMAWARNLCKTWGGRFCVERVSCVSSRPLAVLGGEKGRRVGVVSRLGLRGYADRK
jgi:hypothetical protein